MTLNLDTVVESSSTLPLDVISNLSFLFNILTTQTLSTQQYSKSWSYISSFFPSTYSGHHLPSLMSVLASLFTLPIYKDKALTLLLKNMPQSIPYLLLFPDSDLPLDLLKDLNRHLQVKDAPKLLQKMLAKHKPAVLSTLQTAPLSVLVHFSFLYKELTPVFIKERDAQKLTLFPSLMYKDRLLELYTSAIEKGDVLGLEGLLSLTTPHHLSNHETETALSLLFYSSISMHEKARAFYNVSLTYDLSLFISDTMREIAGKGEEGKAEEMLEISMEMSMNEALFSGILEVYRQPHQILLIMKHVERALPLPLFQEMMGTKEWRSVANLQFQFSKNPNEVLDVFPQDKKEEAERIWVVYTSAEGRDDVLKSVFDNVKTKTQDVDMEIMVHLANKCNGLLQKEVEAFAVESKDVFVQAWILKGFMHANKSTSLLPLLVSLLTPRNVQQVFEVLTSPLSPLSNTSKFYNQKLYYTLLPLLSPLDNLTRNMVLTSLALHLPPTILKKESVTLLPILLSSLTPSSLRLLPLFDSTPYIQDIIPPLLALLLPMASPLDTRLEALTLLQFLCKYEASVVMPFKARVLKVVQDTTGDHKRLVRKKAADVCLGWALI